MKKIYVILMHTNTVPAKLIKFFTRYEYSHVAISLDKKCDTLYSFGRRKVHSVFNGGFVKEYKNGEFFKYFNKTKCKIYELEIEEEKYNKVEKLLNNMNQHMYEYKYDFLGIIPRYFGIPITRTNRYVCSYFVAKTLENAQIYKFDKNVCLIEPKDFEKIEQLNEIYKGYYNLYA